MGLTAVSLVAVLSLIGSSPAGSLPLDPPRADEDAAPGRHVVVFHTNDIHGQVLPRPATWLKDVDPLPDSGGLPRLAANLRALRAEAEATGAAVFVCDGGDWFQGTPEGMLDQGSAFLGALAEAGHDALVVGNHEFDHGVDVFVSHLDKVSMPALLANVRMPDGKPLPGTRDFRIIERDGFKLAFVGLLTTSTPSITHATTRDLVWTEPAVSLARVRAELGDSVDLVVPVTHIGVDADRVVARAHPDLPLIVGGHSHTFLRKGVREGETLIAQAGSKASVIGRVDLWFDAEGKVARSEAVHVNLYSEPDDAFRNPAVDTLCAELTRRAAGRMDEVVGVLGLPLETTRRELVNSSSGNFITDLMRERTGADVAIHNRGGTRTSLEAGPVTRRDLFMILPFSNHLETLPMTGAEVTEMFRVSVEVARKGALEFSGVEVEVRLVEGKPELVRVLLGGETLAPDAELRVTTNSFLAGGGDGWDSLKAAPTREVDSILLRDMLEAAFDGGVRTPNTEQRFRIVR